MIDVYINTLKTYLANKSKLNVQYLGKNCVKNGRRQQLSS